MHTSSKVSTISHEEADRGDLVLLTESMHPGQGLLFDCRVPVLWLGIILLAEKHPLFSYQWGSIRYA